MPPGAASVTAFSLPPDAISAASVKDVHVGLGGTIFATMYDPIMSGVEKAGMAERRRDLLASLTGDVLEIGGGTGANLACYGDVTSLTVTEPEPAMVKRLRRRAEDSGRQADIVEAAAEELPFPDASFDVVVSTLVLCTVRDPERALAEIRRVLRPGGRLIFVEHVRSDTPRLARLQDRVNPVWKVFGAGCNCNRSTLDTISVSGLKTTNVEQTELTKAPPWVRPLIVGTATAT
jgi:ubiquinone/menaquinone biosynthesis C-methylase UbiE